MVARSDKRHGKIHGGMWHISEDEEQYRGTSREVEVEWGVRETIDLSNSGLHHKVTGSG